ncbi:hypothetical protein [Saccharopolyspora griseoalba]|uniref:Uncharacterized protein n=1 Tax=Saccharopolyspora griseoalba TaxID=1431848 RepID=A0ABW2LPX4_9PSEU
MSLDRTNNSATAVRDDAIAIALALCPLTHRDNPGRLGEVLEQVNRIEPHLWHPRRNNLLDTDLLQLLDLVRSDPSYTASPQEAATLMALLKQEELA